MKCLNLVLGVILLASPGLFPATLKEMYDGAPAGSGYDRHVRLETGVIYRGGLFIGKTLNLINGQFEGDDGKAVWIEGRGAILDLEGGEICISYCNSKLDIEDCVIINGNIRYRGIDDYFLTALPTGSVRHVTFYEPHDYAVRIYGCSQNIVVERNIFVDTQDTGPDYIYATGYSSAYLPTGHSVSFSGMMFPYPSIKENWSYFSDPAANSDPMRHFSLLCEYG